MPALHNYPHHICHQENFRIYKSLKQTPKIRRAKFCQKKPTKVLESDFFPKLSSNDDEREDLKQEQDVKLDAKIVEQEPNEQVKDKNELEDLIDEDSNDDNDDDMIWDKDDNRTENEEDKNKRIGVEKGEQNRDKKDECNEIGKDEHIG
ncbi:6768_t:CDS:2, partial [Cetraspora pellucida]